LLEKAALVEIAIGQQRTLFDTEVYPASFNEEAVAGLKRHKSPWTWMIYISDKPLPQPRRTDPYYAEIGNGNRAKLEALFGELTGEAREIQQAWKAVHP
jgi:hypothetical protein